MPFFIVGSPPLDGFEFDENEFGFLLLKHSIKASNGREPMVKMHDCCCAWMTKDVKGM